MRQEGIGVNLHYIPLYSQPYYQLMGFKASDYPEAERYYAEAISLPMFQTLKKSQQLKVVNALKKAIGL